MMAMMLLAVDCLSDTIPTTQNTLSLPNLVLLKTAIIISKKKIMTSSRENTSICLIEHDLNGDTLVTWSYPGVSLHIQALCIEKFNQHHSEKSAEPTPLLFFKVKSDWVYMDLSAARKDICSEITASALCIVTKVFNPEKYQALLLVLHEQFLSSGDPTKILEGYLSVYASEKFKSFDMSSFQDSDAMLAVSCVKDIVRYNPSTHNHCLSI